MTPANLRADDGRFHWRARDFPLIIGYDQLPPARRAMTTASEAYDHGTPQDRQAAKLSWLLWMAVAFIGI
jgi:hypothetical protein